MELDLINTHVELGEISPGEIEEVFEDPFALRFIPDTIDTGESRYFTIGQSINTKVIFLCYNTDGKKAKIIAARKATEEEEIYYQKNYRSFI